MHIAVLSDTHLRPGKSLPGFVWEHLNQVDMILHAGDLTNMGLLEDLSSLAPVRAVSGNCDGWDVALPDRDIIECEGVNIGLIHGHVGKGKTPLIELIMRLLIQKWILLFLGIVIRRFWSGEMAFSYLTLVLQPTNDESNTFLLD